MKTRPSLKTVSAIIIIASTISFIKCKNSQKTQREAVMDFLTAFNKSIKTGIADSVKVYFEEGNQNKTTALLLNLLADKPDLKDQSKPVKALSLNADGAVLNVVNDALVVANIPVSLNINNQIDKSSRITLTLHAASGGRYKIITFDAKRLFDDYANYSRSFKVKSIYETKVFSPITLAAFKSAEKLKTRYDSVLWFQHVAGQTYYYVIKGSIDFYFYWPDGSDEKKKENYKMGLVNPALKEIVPVEFDLVHNVGGIVDGLVEVEKGDKKGFYATDGKIIVPVKYDNIFPLNEDENTALLRQGDDYFYLKKDRTISPKADIKIADVLPKIKTYGKSYKMSDTSWANIMELNSREDFNTLVVTPSYLVDLQVLPKFMHFQNPTRHFDANDIGDGEGSLSVKVNFDGEKKDEKNWFESAFYSFVDDFLGARSGLYEEKKVIMVNKRDNRLMGFKARSYHGNSESGGALSSNCNENNLRAINDTLFEFKTTSALDAPLYDKQTIDEGPYYYYLHIKNGKLEALPAPRIFNCTKYVKLDDSYLSSCFLISGKQVDHVTTGVLQFMKNEVYASYGYVFKDPRWTDVFYYHYGDPKDKPKANAEDSLTAIEKYNVAWINQKLKQAQKGGTTLAAK